MNRYCCFYIRRLPREACSRFYKGIFFSLIELYCSCNQTPLPSLVVPDMFVCLFSRDVARFFFSSMAALYEGYTLCGVVPAQNLSNSGIQGIEEERDIDHVVVTDSTRSVMLYKARLDSFFCSPAIWGANPGQLILD